MNTGPALQRRTVMPTYFFHTFGRGDILDQVGTEIPSAAEAHNEAIRLAGAMPSSAFTIANRAASIATRVRATPGSAVCSAMVSGLEIIFRKWIRRRKA